KFIQFLSRKDSQIRSQIRAELESVTKIIESCELCDDSLLVDAFKAGIVVTTLGAAILFGIPAQENFRVLLKEINSIDINHSKRTTNITNLTRQFVLKGLPALLATIGLVGEAIYFSSPDPEDAQKDILIKST